MIRIFCFWRHIQFNEDEWRARVLHVRPLFEGNADVVTVERDEVGGDDFVEVNDVPKMRDGHAAKEAAEMQAAAAAAARAAEVMRAAMAAARGNLSGRSLKSLKRTTS